MIEQKQLRVRWQLSATTVRRDLQRYGARPKTFHGLRPIFSTGEIRRVEKLREEDRRLRYGRMVKKLRLIGAARKGGRK